MSDYVGIDYGLGQTNVDSETGIRYGVIPLHALQDFILEDFEADYGDPTCPKCGNTVEDYTSEHIEQLIKEGVIASEDELSGYSRHSSDDYICESCGLFFGSDEVYDDEPICYYLDDSEYKAVLDSDNDVIILKSPYYTHAQYCSPCMPGAGHLSHPVAGGPKTYCFGHDFFTENKAPYPVFRVDDNSEVEPSTK